MIMSETPRLTTAEQANINAPAPSMGPAGGAGAGGPPLTSEDQDRVNTAPAAHARYGGPARGGGGEEEEEEKDGMDVDMQGQGQGGISNPQSGLPSGGHHPDHPLASMPAARSMSATNMVEPGQTSPYRMGSIVRKGNKARARQLSNAPPPTTATASATATATAGAGTGAGVVGWHQCSWTWDGHHTLCTQQWWACSSKGSSGTNDAVLRAMRGGKTGSRVLTPQSTTGIVRPRSR